MKLKKEIADSKAKSQPEQIFITDMKERMVDMEKELDAKMNEITKLRDALGPNQGEYCPIELNIELIPPEDENMRQGHEKEMETLKIALEEAKREREEAQAQGKELTHQLAIQYENIKKTELEVNRENT